LNFSINGILIIFFAGLNWFTYKGYSIPEGCIELASPLRNNNYVVLHGGGSPFTNGHFHVRPQNHALDIVGLNAIGGRASSINGGPDLDAYAIYGDSLFSPCVGTVSIAVDEFEDLIPPKTDQKNLAGNHILIECQGAEVLLAHLKKGSIVVQPGDQLETHSFLGLVGNTGNTSEPHLHIHAEKGGDPETVLNGKAVPFTIGGRYLVRGNIFSHK
jgi:murein DD-endopeptidase MepM/ murein hydrolase activator NlpD